MNQDMSEGSEFNGGGEEDELYDEFGNYIGPDLDSSDDDDSEDDSDDESNESNESDNENDADDMETDLTSTNPNNMIIEHDGSEPATAAAQNQIILHEDKIHYPSADTICIG